MTDEEWQELVKLLRSCPTDAIDIIAGSRMAADEEQHKLNAAWRSTPAMRARIRELSRPDNDDYDKAVIAVLDDFEAALAQSDADDPGDATWRNLKERMDMGTKEAIAALAQSDAEPRPQDVRAETAAYRIKAECFDWDGSFNAERAYHIIRAALAQPNGEPIEQARYHLQRADHALHDVEGDRFADHAHTLVHEAAFMITDEPELQALRKLPAQSDAHPTQSEIEYDKRDVLRKARHYVRAVFELIHQFTHQPFILQEIDKALAQSHAELTETPDISEQVWQALLAGTDASAGLIEAAEMAEEEERAGRVVSSFVLRDFAIKLRARAADRSGKP